MDRAARGEPEAPRAHGVGGVGDLEHTGPFEHVKRLFEWVDMSPDRPPSRKSRQRHVEMDRTFCDPDEMCGLSPGARSTNVTSVDRTTV